MAKSRGKGGTAQPRDPRLRAALALGRVLHERQRLDLAVEDLRAELTDQRDAGFARELLSGTVRWYLRLDFLLRRMLSRPLKDERLKLALLIGLYQLVYTRVAPHAAVSSSVDLARKLGFRSASGLVNGVLRRYQREAAELTSRADETLEARYAHPTWMIDDLRDAYPDHWRQILDANNERAPLTLRVNAARGSRATYMQMCRDAGIETHPSPSTPFGLVLEGHQDPRTLPGFADGLVSVQDGAAQLASELLDAHEGAQVLDACAAPGGKTAAILERTPGIGVTAADIDGQRLERTRQALLRLGLSADLQVADATTQGAFGLAPRFSHILADVPCSATGIMRRHPDVKLRREPADGARFATTQLQLLTALWPTLKPGGTLLYATCSLLPKENALVIAAFLDQQADATETTPDVDGALRMSHGLQILPGTGHMDGFYYARLARRR